MDINQDKSNLSLNSIQNWAVAIAFLVIASTSTLAANYVSLTNTSLENSLFSNTNLNHWSMNESAGAIAQDQSTDNIDLVLRNGANWVEGQSGAAVALNGNKQYLSTHEATPLQSPSVTISAWIYPQAGNDSWKWIAAQGDNYGLFLYPDQGQVIFYIKDSEGGWSGVSSTNGVVTYNNWYHLTGSFDATTHTLYLYVDGILAGSNEIGGNIEYTTGNGFTIGSMQTDRFFKGRIDEVSIFNRALDQEAINQLIENPIPTNDNNPPLLTLKGRSPVSVIKGKTYTDAGAMAVDAVDGIVDVVIDDTKVDTLQEGIYKVKISASDLSGNISATTRTVHVIKQGDSPLSDLIGHWPLEGIAGHSVALDQSENGINLSFYAGTQISPAGGVTPVDGISGKAISIDGSNQHFSGLNARALQTSSVYLSAWIKPEYTDQPWEWVAAQGDNYGLFLYPDTGQAVFYIKDSTGDWSSVITAEEAIRFDQWHEIAGGYDKQTHTLRVVVDGIESSKIITGEIDYSTGNGFTIGSMKTERYYKGIIDEVKLFGSNASIPPTPSESGEIIGDWKLFSDASGYIARDSSANGIDLTLTNGASFGQVSTASFINLDGNNQDASIGHGAAALKTTSITLSAWINPIFRGPRLRWIAAQENNYGLYLHPKRGRICFYIKVATNDWSNICTSRPQYRITYDQWAQVTGTFDATSNTLYLYINGEEMGSKRIIGGIDYSAGEGFTIGSMQGERTFKGMIDDVFVANYAMTEAEILHTMHMH